MKAKSFFNDFGFWKFIIITVLSATFSAGVGITVFNNRIETVVKAQTEAKEELENEIDNRIDIVNLVIKDVQAIKQDVGVIKNDVEWIKNNLSN